MPSPHEERSFSGDGNGLFLWAGVRRAEALWAGGRRIAPAGCAEGRAREPGAGRQRLRGCKGRPCRESKGQRPWTGCRVITPAQLQGKALPGVQGRSTLDRVQGGNACADAREGLARSPEAERSGPVKCRKRSGPEGSTLCTGYYPSKTGALQGTQPAAKTTVAQKH